MAASPGRRPTRLRPSLPARSDVTADSRGERKRRSLYGRRKGPKLSPHQAQLLETLLPQLRLNLQPGADPRTYFSISSLIRENVWLEVGFGAGEHLLWQAEHHPDVGLIGAEPYISGIAKLLSRISLAPAGGEGRGEGALPPDKFSRIERPPHPVDTLSLSLPLPQGGRGNVRANIRLHDGDARDILDALPDACLGRVFILFPDPWPKTRHHKRRFIQTETLDALARTMKQGAELRFASDDAGYAAWTLERVIAHPAFAWTATCAADWRSRPSDWPETRYEAKALHGPPVYFSFRRRSVGALAFGGRGA
jgi:tRNA (guanine-N7-)-methyltransferase